MVVFFNLFRLYDTFIGFCLPVFNGNPEKTREKKKEFNYGYKNYVFNNGQANHDETAKTAVVNLWKEKGFSIIDFHKRKFD